MATPVIIDIVAAAILLGFAVYGAKRGLFRALAGLLVIILAVVGARVAAETLTRPAAELVRPLVERHIEQQLDAALEAPEDQPGQMPEEDFGAEDLLGLLGVNEDRMEALAEQAREAVRDTGVSLLTAVAECVTEPVLYSVLLLLSFAVLLVLLRLLAKLLDLALKLPVLHGANVVGGAVVGLLEGLAVLLILTLVLQQLGVSLEDSRILHRFATWLS